MRELMLASQPDAVFPLELRTVAAESAYLSPQFGTADARASVSGQPGHRLRDYLRRVDALLGRVRRARALGQAALPHRGAARRSLPGAEAFIEIRRQLDPDGVFLNDHLRPLFA